MRWPWQPRPGMVRIGHKKLIDLQRKALRAAHLEAELMAAAREDAKREAQWRAEDLVNECTHGPIEARQLADLVLSDLPLTPSGDLHEGAFMALLTPALSDLRDAQLGHLVCGSGDRA